MCDEAPLSPNHYSLSSSLLYYCTSPYNVDPTKRLSESSSFSFPFFSQKSTALCPIFPQLLHSPLKRYFLFLFLFLLSFPLFPFPYKSVTLWTYFPHLLHLPLKKLTFLLFHLFSPAFNARTFSSSSILSCVSFLFNSVLQNQRIYLFRSLNSIFGILALDGYQPMMLSSVSFSGT